MLDARKFLCNFVTSRIQASTCKFMLGDMDVYDYFCTSEKISEIMSRVITQRKFGSVMTSRTFLNACYNAGLVLS